MNKDKITISYILVTIAAFAIILVYYANLDFNSMNDNIEKGGQKALNRGKHYSDKLYTMVSSEWAYLNEDDDLNEKNVVVKKNKAQPKKNLSFSTSSKKAKVVNKSKAKLKKITKGLSKPVNTYVPSVSKDNSLVSQNDSNASERNVSKPINITLNIKKDEK